MKLLGSRVLVSPLEKEEKEGFQTVEVQDSFVYKGKVEQIGEPVDMSTWRGSITIVAGNTGPDRRSIEVGDTVLFAKYSPDTHEFEHEGKKYKSVLISDIIAVL